MPDPLDILVCYVPAEHTEELLSALFAVGAGEIGNYRECAFVSSGRGQFRPLAGANPAIGSVGELEYVTENRIELVFPRRLREKVVAVLRQTHPYEEPAFHVLENSFS